MADFYTQFSCILGVGIAENAVRADAIRGDFAAELDQHAVESLGFDMEVDHESGAGAPWIHSDEYSNPKHVIRLVLRRADDLKLGGLWGFTWSHCCPKPRNNAFGGRGVCPRSQYRGNSRRYRL